MPLPSIKIKRYLLAFILLFCFTTGFAQEKYRAIAFSIDSLANIGLPKSALKEVDKLDALARKDKNAPEQIRAVIYRMTFQSYLEEDALTAIISRLKKDAAQADYPVKPVLQSLLAQMYWNYYTENTDKFSGRTRLLKPDTDYTKWDLQTLINETGKIYDISLQDAAREQNTPVDVLYGVLIGDKNTRYLRPTLYDLLVQRAFDFFLSDEASLPKPKLAFSVNDPRFFSDSRTFAQLDIKTTDTTSIEYKGIKYMQQATAFHLLHPDEEALADLDLQRIKFLYQKSTVANKDSLYLMAIRQIETAFAEKPISAEAIVLEGEYYQNIDSLAIAHRLFEKAVRKYPKSLGGLNAAIWLKRIEQKELSASMEDMNAPGKPLLALVNYHNVKKASVLVYKLTAAQIKLLSNNPEWYQERNLPVSDQIPKLLKSFTPAQQQELTLPDPGDYKKHSAEFKINALSPGIYVLLVKDALSSDSSLMGATGFKVTRLSYVARVNPSGQTEFRVMDRATGEPLKDVAIDVYKWVADKNEKLIKTKVVSGSSDADGKCVLQVHDDRYFVILTAGNDTWSDGDRNFYGYRQYEPNNTAQVSTVLFTDRQLYRPGQTIYFKALKLSTLKGKSTLLPNEEVSIGLSDINNKTISTLQLQTNEFGSVQGSFVIPQTIANGQVRLSSFNGDVYVRVEEYKRPTFQVTFAPVTATYGLTDSVRLKGKVTAFSGYGLSNARVAIHVTNRGEPRLNEGFDGDLRDQWMKISRVWQGIEEVKTDTVITNNQGEFEISFKSNADKKNLHDITLNYSVNAEVTDASGETQTANTIVRASDHPLQITTEISQKLLFNSDAQTSLTLSNINGQPQNGTVKVKIYALKSPGRVFNTRVWTAPDQYILKKDEFIKIFPAYAWGREDNYATWESSGTIAEMNLVASDSAATVLNLEALKKQPNGIYKVVIDAKNTKGDSSSVTEYVDVINAAGQTQKMDDWVVPLVTTVKGNQNAEFLIGVNKPAHVLMETYDGAKLLSARWLDLAEGIQRKIDVPVVATNKNSFSVQFLMVIDNRMYHYYQRISIQDTVKRLDIKFLTFRDKLQPGEKEQWKLQVKSTGSEKVSAEMLATLYDASLDDISPAEYWRTVFDSDPYTPDYFVWENNDFVREDETSAYKNYRFDKPIIDRDYETLYLFGYDYYGGDNQGYNTYLDQVAEHQKAAKHDKLIADKYFKNAALVKNGYDVSGRIIDVEDNDEALAGVSISIRNMNITTLSNSAGYFRIKVPTNSMLMFKLKGYVTRSLTLKPGSGHVVMLAKKELKMMRVADSGVKYLKGDKNADVTIDEPVGYYNNSVNQVRFPPPVVAEYAVALPGRVSEKLLRGQAAGVSIMANAAPGLVNNVVMREIRTAPGVKFDKELLIAASHAIVPRTNFNETAFFYPQLHTNEKGEILIDFTIPEALTRWKFRGFAHTKDLETGYIENTVVTQKQLSISANTPRFLREGDTITISARLANLTADKLKGKVQMQLFNALNMQPVALFVNAADASQTFEVEGNTNKAISFKLVIPAGLDALTYRLTADAGQFTDGEENTLPVLPNRMLVTESMPMMVRAGQTRNFIFDKLVNQNSTTLKSKTLTLEYTSNPAWYAVQALPYMMEFPYECSEQIFSRYFANSLATSIVTKLPAIKQVFDQWKNTNSTELLSNLEKNQELKATLIEETPWLKDAENESEQKKRIALLFDLNKMSDELKLNLEKLQKRQLPDGGFTWFGGNQADRYITQHIAEGIGELYHLGIATDQTDLKNVADNAIRYLDNQLLAEEKERIKQKPAERGYDDIDIDAWFTRSYFLTSPMSSDLKAAFKGYLNWAQDKWTQRNAYEQGMIALTMQRNNKPDVAAQIERSLFETAQQSDELGMYWAKNQRGYFWYESPVETQSLLIELFTEVGDNTKAVDEMKVWLIRNKQTNDWKTTKATAVACYALLLKGSNLLADTSRSVIKLDGKPLEQLKPDVKADAGTGYIKASWADEQVKPNMGKVEIKNAGATISYGALHWQYLENLDKITSAETNIKLERKYFIQKQTDAGPVLTAVDDTHLPKTGDLLKVVVYLKADRDFEYVQLKDLRPAGTEPVDALSQYKYQDGLSYYQVTKDVATNFFISYLNKGNYVFEYQLRVAQPGNFSTGITSIQCMYAPEFNAHSQGGRMVIKP